MKGRLAIALWLACLAACIAVIVHTRFSADLSAFLPKKPTQEQKLLLDQLREGVASRLLLAGIEGADSATRARISREMARQMRADATFASVENGEPVNFDRDRIFLFDNRYLLSSAVTPAHMSAEGLHAAIGDSIELLASPAGMLTRQLLARDPTGEMVRLIGELGGGNRPRSADGVWVSRDAARALLLVRTRALGSDTDGQEHAIERIRAAFETARGDAAATLAISGSGMFAVISRATIKHEAHRLFFISSAIIITLLLLVYRSPAALALGVLPVVSGAAVGVAAVSLGFGGVHGITLAFGTALIGEAVDYSIYLFVQSEQGGSHTQDWIRRVWPTVRLGVLTSIAGFAALLFSGFPGLAQLGLYAIAGLTGAALVTRFVLPHLLPARFRIHDMTAIGTLLGALVARAGALRWLALAVVAASSAVLAVKHATLWNTSISSLNPLRDAEMAIDSRLRADLGAPNARFLVAVSGASREATLQGAEKAAAVLREAVDKGELAGFETPSRYLPSEAAQRARQASLPASAELQARLTRAVEGLPLNAARLSPFVIDVEKARSQPLITAATLERTSMGLAVDALLLNRGTHWSALLPLTSADDREIDAAQLRKALASVAASTSVAASASATAPTPAAQPSTAPDILLVDIKAESSRLYEGYLNEAILLSLGGVVTLIALLFAVLHSVARVARVIAPLGAAVLTVSAALALTGHQLTILHLVGLLLVVAIGSNYALFFDRGGSTAPITPHTLASMLLANLTAVTGFGLLAFSQVSILQALGITVAPGVVLALLYAAIFARRT